MSAGKIPVECGKCGWTGKRKPGNVVLCPQCGSFAAFQCTPTNGDTSVDD